MSSTRRAVESPRLPLDESRAGPQPRAKLRHWIEYGAYRTATTLMTLIPERFADFLAQLLGRFVYRLIRVRRAEVHRHLLRAFPDQTEAWRRRVAEAAYVHFVRETVQTLRSARWTREELLARTEVVGLQELERALEKGRGAMVLTGHLGNWEVGAAAVAARGVTTDVVAHRQTNPLFDEYWIRLREGLRLRTLVKNDAFRLIPRSLEDSEKRRPCRHIPPIGDGHLPHHRQAEPCDRSRCHQRSRSETARQ